MNDTVQCTGMHWQAERDVEYLLATDWPGPIGRRKCSLPTALPVVVYSSRLFLFSRENQRSEAEGARSCADQNAF